MRRIATFFSDAVHLWRKGGFRSFLRFVRSRLLARTDTLLYDLRPDGSPPVLPQGWQVREVTSIADAEGVGLMLQVGGEAELRHFHRRAVAYVATIEGRLVARCWSFPEHPLARRMGPDTVYFGCMFVRPECRGQGIQGRLNAYLAALQPKGSRIIMEVEHSNIASQRGLLRGGSRLLGRLLTFVVLGQIVRTRLEPVAEIRDPGSRSTADGAPPPLDWKPRE
jgi:GNAT superfamily N-acetyltransferase